MMDRDTWVRSRAGDKDARDAISTEYLPLVRRVSLKLWRSLPPHIDRDDVFQYGVEGLMRAIDNYNFDQGTAFETYAVPSIRGRIVDQLREMDWAPRSLRRRQRDLARAEAALSNGHHPSDDQLENLLGWEPGLAAKTRRDADAAYVVSLEEKVENDASVLEQHVSGDIMDLMHITADMVELLPHTERAVVVLYYYEGMTLAGVASVLGMTESRVSQINIRFTARLRTILLEALGGKNVIT